MRTENEVSKSHAFIAINILTVLHHSLIISCTLRPEYPDTLL
jgi:hypothetical protein